MYVVIFRARVRATDDEYLQTAARLRELALQDYGCLRFHSIREGDEEIALSYWPDRQSISAWKSHPAHALAQQRGRERWYESYSVEVALVDRSYDFAG